MSVTSGSGSPVCSLGIVIPIRLVLKTISAVQCQCQIIVFALVLVFFGSLLFIKNNQMFNMRRTREKVVATVVDNAVVLLE